MIKAVVDTNVFVSGLLSDTGAPAKLILRWLKGQFDLVISEEMLEEYDFVLSHLEKIDPDKASQLLAEVRASASVVVISGQLQACKDPDDDKFLESAVLGNAEFLVTKNIKHFPFKSFQNVRIIKISKFLSELEKQFPE